MAGAQQSPSSANAAAQKATVPTKTVVVTGTAQPVPLSESDRPVALITTAQDRLLFNSVIDYLRSDRSIDLRQRGVDGVQADLSILGSSFAQALVLINGMRVNDAQTGHHNMDLPIPLESLSRIEVLHGAGSTLYGADALGGAVNFITAPPISTEFRLRAGIGSFGFNQQRFSASLASKAWSESMAADRDFSTGFRSDHDFRTTALSSHTHLKTTLGNTSFLLAASDRSFGADQFYGDFPSWERTKGWLVLLQQELGANTLVEFGYRRHSDEFILLRGHPEVYENNHTTQSWQAVVRRLHRLGNNSTVSYGVEGDGDQIDSNNLGQHFRHRGAGYVGVDCRALHRFSVSLGAREELFRGGRAEFVPSLAGGMWLKHSMRLRVSGSRGFRLPTYTDLYYRDPANIGNPLLKPESSWTLAVGPEFNPGGHISGEVTAFYRRDKNGIDYIKTAAFEPWQAANIQDLQFVGAQVSIQWRANDNHRFQLSYTGLHGSQAVPHVLSRYALNYARHNLGVWWLGHLPHGIAVRNQLGIIQRYAREAYPLWDISLARNAGVFRPYLQLDNIGNSDYQEIPGVHMPGRSVVVGAEFFLATKANPAKSRR